MRQKHINQTDVHCSELGVDISCICYQILKHKTKLISQDVCILLCSH